jgi:surface antigen
MTFSKLIAVVAAVALLAACESNRGQKETAGTLLGAIGGAVAGAQFGSGKGQLAAVAAGTLLGAFIGSEVGKSLDRADLAYMERTNQRALETTRSGTTSTWRNPDSGNQGTITPQPAVQTSSGDYCREYTQTITVAGKTETAVGTACRNPDGTWRIVNN